MIAREFEKPTRGKVEEDEVDAHAMHTAPLVRTREGMCAEAVGLSVARLAGHSLRAGFVTEAKKNGADDAAIMDQTGHKSLATVHGYNRRKKKVGEAREREARPVKS
jgi:integrase